MKNKILIYSLALVSSLVFTACTKYLDVKPKGYIIPKTQQDFERILNSNAITRSMDADIEKFTDDYYNSGLNSAQKNLTSDDRIYSWQANLYEDADEIYSAWYSFYNRIFQLNAVINNIDQATEGSPEKKKSIKARALFARADAYFSLVNLYAKPYEESSAATDLGVPYVMDADIVKILPSRGSVKQTYDLMIQDLEKAIPDLPNSLNSIFDGSQTAAYGLLSRIYLFKKDNKKCVEYANKALVVANKLLDYNTIYTPNTNTKFPYADVKIEMLNGPAPQGISVNTENIYVGFFTMLNGMFGQEYSDEVYAIFSPYDIRKFLFSGYDYDGISYTYYGAAIPPNINLTSPELYLMRAEANARLGNLAVALNDLNTLRKNRIVKEHFVALNSTNKLEVLKWIYEDRRREFLYKGKRWFDLRRLANDPDFGIVVKHKYADGSIVELPKNSPRYVLKIPVKALTNGIAQNP